MWKTELSTVEDWASVAKRVREELQYPILLLKGNLGAGKTTFTQYLMRELGSEDEVTSPTYSIVNEYDTPKGKVYHFDLYRLKDIEEVYDIGIEDYLGSAFLCIIEWPEVLEDELYEKYHVMEIGNVGKARTVKFSNEDPNL